MHLHTTYWGPKWSAHIIWYSHKAGVDESFSVTLASVWECQMLQDKELESSFRLACGCHHVMRVIWVRVRVYRTSRGLILSLTGPESLHRLSYAMHFTFSNFIQSFPTLHSDDSLCDDSLRPTCSQWPVRGQLNLS